MSIFKTGFQRYDGFVCAFLLAALLVVLCGCANLKHKGVVWGGSGFTGVLSTAVDPETGAIMPTAKMIIGDGFFADLPVADGKDTDTNLEFYFYEKSLWSGEVSIMRYIRMGGGTGADVVPAVRIEHRVGK